PAQWDPVPTSAHPESLPSDRAEWLAPSPRAAASLSNIFVVEFSPPFPVPPFVASSRCALSARWPAGHESGRSNPTIPPRSGNRDRKSTRLNSSHLVISY